MGDELYEANDDNKYVSVDEGTGVDFVYLFFWPSAFWSSAFSLLRRTVSCLIILSSTSPKSFLTIFCKYQNCDRIKKYNSSNENSFNFLSHFMF